MGMADLNRVMELNFKSEDEEQVLSDLYDWSLSRAFIELRHLEKIEGNESHLHPQTWRMKERMKTVSVALVLCLNIGVDPPGVVKTQPCARLECWIDPTSLSQVKALETIGATLQKQYERWQPRARYKQSLDPTSEEIKKLCTSLRRNAKDERVLFHYNGHGVPQPTNNGEIWVFNRNYTQYIPLSIYDLQTWMGSPSIYVYDCPNAGIIIKSFHQFAEQHEKEYEEMLSKSSALSSCSPPNFSNCIQLASCGEGQSLPMNPDLPADLFTSCLTTPIKIALKWFVLQNKDKLMPHITLEMIDKVPGQLNDRRTMLGELNWIFTAITDTIAWNTLPRNLFQRLFRQDLLVASLFRNYLLAERIMRSYDCMPTSSPKLPPTYQHPMWFAWDFALDLCLGQLPAVLEELKLVNHENGNNNNNNNQNSESIITNHIPSPFFEEQLTAFEVWLSLGSENRSPPEQLPIVLQVLLSQVHRVRALELLGRFLDLGWWAVNLALSVGIFPYVLKLLQSSARELRPLLVFIWAKILAVDHSCQSDLVRDSSHKYFTSMIGDTSLPYEHRTMAVFVLSMIVRNYRPGQEAALQANSITTCLEALNENDSEHRRWVCICLGLTWADYPESKWCGVRDSAHEKIYDLLGDPNPEVRAGAVFALGTFINSANERTEHANAIDHSVTMTIINKLCGEEASPLVRQEIVVALHNFMLVFENNFITLEQQHLAAQDLQAAAISSPAGGSGMRRISSQTRMKILGHISPANTVTGADTRHALMEPGVRRVASSNSLASLFAHGPVQSPISSSVGGIYGKVLTTMQQYERDPFPGVALLAKTVMDHIRVKAREQMALGNKSLSIGGNQSPSPDPNKSSDSLKLKEIVPLIATKYIEWCWERFARPSEPGKGFGLNNRSDGPDPQDPIHHTRGWRYSRNANIRRDCFRRNVSFPGKIEELIFNSRTLHSSSASSSHGSSPSTASSSPSFVFSSMSSPSLVKMHEYEKVVVASEGSSFTIYDYHDSPRIAIKSEQNSYDSRITSLEWVNSHDESLVMIGADDGSIRFWSPDYERGKARLVTSFNALSDMGHITKSSKSYGLLAKWDSERENVLATGDARVVRVWDVKTELKKGDWATGSETPVSCMDIHRCEPNIAVLGFEEGAVRLIDFRLPNTSESCVATWREFGDSWVVGATLRYDRIVVAGSANGKLRIFDLRSRSASKTIETNSDITALCIHSHLPYFATGCLNHSVNIYGLVGHGSFMSNSIREGLFISGRMGAVSSLHFHPYKPILSIADSYSVNVYKTRSSHT